MRTVDKTSEDNVENKNKKTAKDQTIQSPQETGSKTMSFNIPNLKNYVKNKNSGQLFLFYQEKLCDSLYKYTRSH